MKIDGIPTETFYTLLDGLRADGWKAAAEYAGFDKAIDYDSAVFTKNGVKLKLVWAVHLDGSLEGPAAYLLELRGRYGLE